MSTVYTNNAMSTHAVAYESRQMDSNLNIRMDTKTAKKLEWLSRVSHWPKSMIVRLLIGKAQPSDLAVSTEDALDTTKDEK